jgi:hypothetical protein
MSDLITRPVSLLPPGTAVSRYLMVNALARDDGYRASVLAERFNTTPQVAACLTAELQGKAAIAPGTTTDSTWASPLAAYGIASEALQLIRGASILGALEPKFRRVPFRTKVPRETGSGTGGAWVGEGLSTPAAATAYDTLSMESYKAQKIVVLSQELLKLGDPGAERAIRESVAAGVGAFLDGELLTPTVTLSAGLRPASIANDETEVTSTGSTAAQITADLASLLAAIATDAGSLVWVMRPTTAATIAMRLAGAGQPTDLPRSLFGAPVVISANSPAQVTLIDAAHILYADDGAIEIDTTEEATIQMTDTPVDPAIASTVFESLWQKNRWAVKVTKWLAYLRAQDGAVSWMTVAY